MKNRARRIAGAGPLPALLLLLAGLALAVAALLLLPGGDAPPAAAGGAEDGVAGAAPPQPAELSDPGSIHARVPDWRPDGTLPPDSPYRAGVRPEHALIRGRVVAREVEAWPRRVEVWLEREDGGAEVARANPTRESPGFRFERVPFGSYRLRLEADGVTPISMLVTASEGSPDQFQDLPLRPAAGVRGLVLTRAGDPAVSAPVTVEPLPRTPQDAVVPLPTWTDERGEFLVQGLVEGEYAVYPGPPRAPVGERVVVRVGPGAPEAWVRLELPPLGRARVVLEDPQQAGLAGVRVKAQRIRVPAAATAYEETRIADAGGALVFTTLPPGEYAFTAWGGAFASVLREALVAEGIEPEVRIPLKPAARGPR